MSAPTTSLSLYETEDRYLALCNSEELVAPDQQEAFRAELAEALKTAVQKRDRVAAFIRTCERHEDAIDAEIERLKNLKAYWQRGRERMEQFVISVIESMGKDEKGKYRQLKGETCILSVAQNPPSVEVTDESEVPPKYKCVNVTLPATTWADICAVLPLEGISARSSVDKRSVKAAIDAGGEVPGADLRYGDLRLKVR